MSNPNEVMDINALRAALQQIGAPLEGLDEMEDARIFDCEVLAQFIAQQNAALLRELQGKQEFSHETGWAIPASILEAKLKELDRQI